MSMQKKVTESSIAINTENDVIAMGLKTNKNSAKKYNRLKRHVRVRKIIIACVMCFFLISCAAFHFNVKSSQSQSNVSADILTADLIDTCCEKAPSEESEVQLHFIMIAGLVLVGGSLGMVLFNMKMNKEEQEEK